MAPGPDSATHDCEWRGKAEALEEKLHVVEGQLSSLKQQLDTLMRRTLGPKSEKMPPVGQEPGAGEEKKPDWEAVQRKRRERQKKKAALETITTVHPVAESQRTCPKCGRTDMKRVGEGKVSTLYEYVPARIIAHRQVRETLACACGECVVTAEGPVNWQEKSRYAPSMVAHLITAKCADSIPLYRLEKEFQRLGIPLSRSTMTDLFHTAADVLEPLSRRLLDIIRESEVVHADETSLKVQAEGECRNGFVWNFRTTWPAPLIAYRFAPSRSGDTPRGILGGTKGALMVDGYTGYNTVTDVDGRDRGACHAHVRRYFFDAMKTAPEAAEALALIAKLYRVESDACEAAIAGTAAHLELRRTKSRGIRDALKAWLDAQQPRHPPKSPMGDALRYTLNRWDELGLFLENVRVPLDNNPAEAALRRVALGRKNFLFVGNDEAGENLAGLYSLVATCEANDVNPLAYLQDVLTRVHTHPNSRIDELLPHNWHGPPPAEPGDAT
ncbi:MAG: IS66 family transposase [Myxococcus sp.]|nr:IS66 family transposase [Myxococcus sp.]